jgi:hypothetical protein
MNLELSIYILAALTGVTALLSGGRTGYFLVFIFVYFVYLIIARNSELGIDLRQFADWFQYGSIPDWGWHEFLFFLVGQTLFSATNSIPLTYIFFDLIWMSVAIFAFKLVGTRGRACDWSGAVVYLMSFMVLLGSQNFIRQHVGISFTLLGYALTILGFRVRAAPITAIGIFFHNSTALGGIIVFMRTFFGKNIVAWFLGSILTIFLLIWALFRMSEGGLGEFRKSNAATGLDLGWVYVALLVSIWLFVFYLYKYKLEAAILQAPSSSIGAIVTGVMCVLFNSAPAERIGMMFVSLALIDVTLAFSSARTKYRRLWWAGLFFMFFLPSVIFYNARQFLTVF